MKREEINNHCAERNRTANQGHLIGKQTSLRYVKMWEVIPNFDEKQILNKTFENRWQKNMKSIF